MRYSFGEVTKDVADGNWVSNFKKCLQNFGAWIFSSAVRIAVLAPTKTLPKTVRSIFHRHFIGNSLFPCLRLSCNLKVRLGLGGFLGRHLYIATRLPAHGRVELIARRE